jgi:hypothetical protein
MWQISVKRSNLRTKDGGFCLPSDCNQKPSNQISNERFGNHSGYQWRKNHGRYSDSIIVTRESTIKEQVLLESIEFKKCAPRMIPNWLVFVKFCDKHNGPNRWWGLYNLDETNRKELTSKLMIRAMIFAAICIQDQIRSPIDDSISKVRDWYLLFNTTFAIMLIQSGNS